EVLTERPEHVRRRLAEDLVEPQRPAAIGGRGHHPSVACEKDTVETRPAAGYFLAHPLLLRRYRVQARRPRRDVRFNGRRSAVQLERKLERRTRPSHAVASRSGRSARRYSTR